VLPRVLLGSKTCFTEVLVLPGSIARIGGFHFTVILLAAPVLGDTCFKQQH
jgi:hypothetical protein